MEKAVMSRATRKLQQRCQALGDQAKGLVTRGQHDEALARLGEALDIAGGLAEANPADARPQQMRAVILRELSDLHRATGNVEQALGVLAERMRVCRELASRHGLDTRREQAEIEAREGVLMARQESGASAVCHLENALDAYLRLLGENELDKGDELTPGFCQVLIDHAEVLMRYGDPDLAAGVADGAWRLYIHQHDTPGWDAALMGKIAKAASAILARNGRLDDAVSADACVVLEAREAAQASRSAADRTRLATALAIQGLHLNATGRQDSLQKAAECLAQSQTLDSAAAVEAIAEWERARSEAPPVTLAAALSTAARMLGRERVLAGLPEALTSGPGKLTFRVSRLCDLQHIPVYAVRLASVAVDLLPVAVREGLRIGLEAHYLFAIGWSSNRSGGIRCASGASRGRASSSSAAGSSPPTRSSHRGFRWLALDLATWNLERIDMLLLSVIGEDHAASDPAQTPDRAETAQLLRDCLTQHAELLDTDGDHAAQTLRQKAAIIGNRH
jgi:tetratricopeptide (TPR) repeat protein